MNSEEHPSQDQKDGASDDPAPGERCPLDIADEKHMEAHFFIHEMMEKYHDPYPFRWCLNAFLSALQSVVWQTEAQLKRWCRENGIDGYGDWLKAAKADLFADDGLVKRFSDGRHVVVHEGELTHKSKVFAGLFRGRSIKMGFTDMEIDPAIPSEEILRRLNELPDGGFIWGDHGAIGEQHGVKRHWFVEELCEQDQDVLEAAHAAWVRVGHFLADAHEFIGITAEKSPDEEPGRHSPDRVNILLEGDLDPSLYDKWGWT